MAINLQKGQRISLEKSNGSKLQNICVGINWGAIEKKGLFGLAAAKKRLTLMPAALCLMTNKKLIDVVYFGNLKSKRPGRKTQR
jgi:tellurium resistance protein TerZ